MKHAYDERLYPLILVLHTNSGEWYLTQRVCQKGQKRLNSIKINKFQFLGHLLTNLGQERTVSWPLSIYLNSRKILSTYSPCLTLEIKLDSHHWLKNRFLKDTHHLIRVFIGFFDIPWVTEGAGGLGEAFSQVYRCREDVGNARGAPVPQSIHQSVTQPPICHCLSPI